MRRGLLTPIAIGAVAVAGLSAWSPLPRELRSSAVAGEDSADPAPATGRVRCKVYDENENPIPDGATLRLRPARRSDGNFVYDDTPHADDACATVRDGSALFERVGLGQELEVVFIDERGEREPAAHRFTGPASPDEETATRIDLRPARPVLTGRLVDTSGRPVVALQVAGDLVETKEDEDASNWFAPTVTDSRGRFRMAFGFRKLPLRGAKLLLGAYVEGADGGSGHHEFASVSLPAVVGAGTTDVGDVVYRGGELLVGGVVVGPDGKPVAGAVVVAMEECGQRLVFQGDLGTYESTDSVTDSDRHWSRTPLSDVSFVETDAEGRFRLLGAPPKQRLHLGVRLADHYMANEPEFQLGAANVRVVMSEAGGIAGSLQVPDGVDPHDLAVSIDGEAARNGDVEYHFGG